MQCYCMSSFRLATHVSVEWKWTSVCIVFRIFTLLLSLVRRQDIGLSSRLVQGNLIRLKCSKTSYVPWNGLCLCELDKTCSVLHWFHYIIIKKEKQLVVDFSSYDLYIVGKMWSYRFLICWIYFLYLYKKLYYHW